MRSITLTLSSSSKPILGVIALLISSWVIPYAEASEPDHQLWNSLLKSHVINIHDGHATQVDYRAIQQEAALLKRYLDHLSAVKRSDFDQWSNNQQLAFLINAYNAWTVQLILSQYPNLDSIKDLGGLFKSPWKQEFIPLLEQTRSLDNIEHTLIRGSSRYNDPRIHFAVNCASIGCPALRAEAYTADKLDAQLEEQTQLFLADQSRNRLRDGRLEVSSIFKWYREDFEKGWEGTRSLAEFLTHYRTSLGLTDDQKGRVISGEIDITFLDYDWRLNDKP